MDHPKILTENNCQIIMESLVVDGSANTVTKVIEYQVIYLQTKELIVKSPVFQGGTNNLAEFLAIVTALIYLKKNGLSIPVYSDSQTAIAWVRNKDINTTMDRTVKNERLFGYIDKSLKWLKENPNHNIVMKWNTKEWGENPADYGRK